MKQHCHVLILLDVLKACPNEPLLLVRDGMGWHKAKALTVPCNPTEHIWVEHAKVILAKPKADESTHHPVDNPTVFDSRICESP